MKYFFIVQGEGSGHLTQSLALLAILKKNGHSVETFLLGKGFLSKKNGLQKDVKHDDFFSPFLFSNSDKTGVSLFKTFAFNLLFSPVYIFTIFRLAYRIRTSGADRVIVFYDMIGQLAAFFSFSGKPVFSVSHHFFFEHLAFKWPASRRTEKIMLKMHSYLASFGAREKLALSFTSETSIPAKKLIIVPPLLRPEIKELQAVSNGHIHVYSLQAGFLKDAILLANKYPKKEFRIFLHEFENNINYPSNVLISLLSGEKFVQSLKTCGAVISTAGFETLAEAAYLDKPLIVIPSKGHFEQYCNAMDASRAGIALITEDICNIDLPESTNNPGHHDFIKWVCTAEDTILNIITA